MRARHDIDVGGVRFPVVVDPIAPPGVIYVVDMARAWPFGLRAVVHPDRCIVLSGETWGHAAALNLAAAYRPEIP